MKNSKILFSLLFMSIFGLSSCSSPVADLSEETPAESFDPISASGTPLSDTGQVVLTPEESCANLESEEKTSCLDDAYISKAIGEADEQFCNEITSLETKDACFANVIYNEISETNDPTACEKFGDEEKIKKCKKEFAINTAITTSTGSDPCSVLEGEDRDECVLKQVTKEATNSENVEICDQLKNEDSKNTCISEYWMGKALKEKNIENCDKIIEAKKKATCADIMKMFKK